jgi:peroxiredoxin
MKNNFLILMMLFLSFAIQGQSENGYLITGKVKGFPNNTLIYLNDANSQKNIDSTFILNGNFILKGQINGTPKFLRLQSKVKNQFIYTNLFIGNEKVNISGSIEDFPYDVKIKGSKSQVNLNKIINLTKSYFIENKLIVGQFMKLSNVEKSEKSTEFNNNLKRIHQKIDSIEVEYIKSNLNTYVAVMYLDMKKNTLPKETVQKLYNGLSPELKKSDFAKPLKVFLNIKIADIGEISPNIKAYNKTEKLINLTDLRGKYVLLDFTATGCAPCVASMDDLRELNKNYNNSLTVVSYSQDSNKSIWLKTLKKHKPSWINLWDGSGSKGKTSIEYGINSIPAFFLINPEGIIIEKWRGFSGKGSLLKRLNRFKNK